VSVEPPKPVTPVTASGQQILKIPPVIIKPTTEVQKVQGALKLGSDGKLNPESYPMIDKVVEVHKQKPSIIKILYRKKDSSQSLVEEIRNYVVNKGCSKKDVLLEISDSLEKPIKISILPK
jgi:hypothetical protein